MSLKYLRELKEGETVKVYRNLNRSCWSVRDSKDHVIAHADTLILENVKFVVRKAGKKKAQETGQRNFHAYAKGEYKENAPVIKGGSKLTGFCPRILATYSPFVTCGFRATREATEFNAGGNWPLLYTTAALFLPNGEDNVR